MAWSVNHLGDVARDRGDLAEARRLYQEGADTFRRLGERWGMARSSTDLGYLACDQDDPATAHSLFEEALRIFLELGHKRGIAKVLEGFAYLAAHQHNPRARSKAGRRRQLAAADNRSASPAPASRRSWTPPWSRRGSTVTPRPPKPRGRPGGECGLRTPFSTLWTARHQSRRCLLKVSRIDHPTNRCDTVHSRRRLTERAPGSGFRPERNTCSRSCRQ